MPCHADPFYRLASDFSGSELWREFTQSTTFSETPKNTFKLDWDLGNLARYKETGGESFLLQSRGGNFNYQYSDPSSFFNFEWLRHEVETGISSDGMENRLDGIRNIVSIAGGINADCGDSSSLKFVGRYTYLQDSLSGMLPTLVNGIPGFEISDDSGLNWDESGWGLEVSYQERQSLIGVAYGQSDNHFSLNSMTGDDEISLRVSAPGYFLGIFGEAPLDSQTLGRAYFYDTRSCGDEGIYRQNERLGPMRGGVDSRHFGFQLSDSDVSNEWELSITRGIYTTNLSGSADISSFGEPVFGIVTPRIHFDSFLRLSLTTALFGWNAGEFAGSEIRLSGGATRWNIDDSVRSWESYLFGGGILNESETGIDIESGWLGHVGFEASWHTTDSDKIILFVGQTIPISVAKFESEKPGLVTGKSSVWDGGRWISLSYIIEF